MKRRTLILSAIMILAVLLSACAGAAAQAQAQTPNPGEGNPSIRTLSVSGNAKVQLSPDIAYIYIGVHTENANANEAVTSNNTQAQKVIDALKAQGIDARDIQTTNFSIYPSQQPETQPAPQSGPSVQGQKIVYVVDNTVYVTVRDLSKIGDILGAATDAGANSINGIQFDVVDKTAAMSEARKAAVGDARKTAEQLASAAGVTLGDIQSINFNTGGYPIPMFEGKGGGAMMAASSVPVSSGQMTLSVDVNIVYAIQ